MQKSRKFNPYTELDVPKTADQALIKSAYRKLALKWHPDKHPESDREQATEKFKMVSEAYSILSNEKRKSYFDKHGCMEGEDDQVDFDDIFSQMFGKAGASFTFSFDEMFDDFSDVLKGSRQDNKAFKKLFKDLGRGARIKQPKGRVRKNKAPKMPKMGGGGMEDMMMAMMMGDMMGGGKKKGKKGGGMEEMMMEMMMGDMMGDMMGSSKKKGPFDDYDDEGDLFGSDEEYDSDEVEMIGKQMGLNKKEMAELKRDLKFKYSKK